MNVEIGAEAALFPEKEYKSGISVAVSAKFASNSQLDNDTRNRYHLKIASVKLQINVRVYVHISTRI